MKKPLKIVAIIIAGIIAIPVLIGIISGISGSLDDTPNTGQAMESSAVEKPSYLGKTYAEMTRFERKEWFDAYTANSPEGINSQLLEYVRSKFNHPETVKFTNSSFVAVNNLTPIDWEKGIFGFIGEASAENAFKQRSKSQYFIHVQLSDSSWQVVDFGIQ